MNKVDAYLQLMRERHASDLFLTTGAPPSVKINGVVHGLDAPKLVVGEVREIADSVMTEVQREQFARGMECNFSWSRTGYGRYRVNVYLQRGEVAIVMRMIDSQIPDFAALGLPPVAARLAMLNRGLVLVAGAAGSGKSTTLAAMIKYRSQHASGHILTIEDPIEFLFSHDKSIVDQREVGIDTLSFAEALRNALREAPDVIMLGEIRDLETARHAIAYAETGHLCISTLHAANASQAVERMVGLFPDEAHPRVRQDLSLHLKGIISQMLIPALHGGRVLAVEVLLQTTYISDLIQRGLFNEIRAEMAKGNEHGMMTFDQCLFDNYKAGRISAEQAVAHADSVANLKLKIRLSAHHSTADAPPGLAMNDMPLKNF